MLGRIPLKLEKKLEVNLSSRLFSLFLAILGSVVVSSILIITAGKETSVAFSALLGGGFGGWESWIETLVKSTPLILTGLAATVAFRGKIWNIGAEGQLYAGAMAAFWTATTFSGLPQVILVPLVLIASIAGGGVCGWIPGYLKAVHNVNEIIVTVMMNYIIRYLLSFMLLGAWKDPSSYYQQTVTIPENSTFPLLFTDTRLHLGFLVAVLAAVFLYILLWKTPFGIEVRALGHNPIATKFKGIDISKVVIVVMLISGGIAGLAGAGELNGLQHRLRPDLATGYGFTGIIIAMLAGLHPLLVIPAAVFFGGLLNGSVRMQIYTGIPVALVYVIQAVVLLFLLTANVTSKYRLRWFRS
jgi:general nucleoside transport system permease protein